MDASVTWWVLFNVFVLAMLALDLGVFHRKAHEVHLREALAWTGVWVTLALLFNAGLWYWQGGTVALQFLTGYFIEKALSVDNIFVFVLIFSAFGVPAAYQHRVLFWGILGALVMRASLITAGIVLIQRFHWVIYVFGAFLVITGIKMAVTENEEVHPERNPVLKLFRRLVPVTPTYEGQHFIVTRGGRRYATPLLLVLVLVETSDLIFAFDSIPAVLAITTDPFIVYTSNVFAILGLRALYFALAGVVRMFHYLHYGLSFVLVFVGVKMLIVDWYKIPVAASLGVIALLLTAAVIASIAWPKKPEEIVEQVKPIGEPIREL
jgi:tellurite resistance protein TerC